ncbi:hypothetical protein SAMN04488498_1323 [Mesorhizobium albiziae]|uniref:Uncharacterized protein n=1 Tax=Neomesorhizobium albiziae TaxID=335020 RepID=A0A1I4EY63_9HYPH|nr:hypothetical protein [Mesorhizobium albiziae]GLS30675.1 hypothetical protein GCM10007937_23830 [Mesorhizobium albiziae]SFL10133.1 hypothetical protein SAMN04488498_1323 [Mesorhizobium albiziae]
MGFLRLLSRHWIGFLLLGLAVVMLSVFQPVVFTKGTLTFTKFPEDCCGASARNPLSTLPELPFQTTPLLTANYIYNIVDEMWRDQPVDIVFKISPTMRPLPILHDVVPGERNEGLIPVSAFVSVKMRGVGGIDVTPIDDVKKQVSDYDETSWQWKVTPKTTGVSLLYLVVYSHLGDADAPPYTLKTYEDVILVRVSAYQRVKDVAAEIAPIWLFVAGGTGIPAILAAFYWFRGKKPPAEDPTEV